MGYNAFLFFHQCRVLLDIGSMVSAIQLSKMMLLTAVRLCSAVVTKLLQNFRMTCGNCFAWIDSNWSTPTVYSSDFSQSTIKCCFEFLTTRKTLSLKQGLNTVACEVSSLFCLPWKHFLKLHISSVPIAYTSASKYGLQNSYTIPLS